jgi:uncharacterized RDD family membrane protein YckC
MSPGPSGTAGPTAGFVSRVAAMIIDVLVIAATFYGGLAMGTLTVQVLRVRQLDLSAIPTWLVPILLGGWTLLYFWVAWWWFGKTVGKAVLGLRVVSRSGGRVGWARALVRLFGYGLSTAAFGLGFLWVAVDRRRRDWADMVAGTRVVYDWRVRAARLESRVVTRESPLITAGSSDGDDDLTRLARRS